MALDFPSSPSVDQIHSAGGKSWRWDGTSWVAVTGAGATGPTGPAGPTGPVGPAGVSPADGILGGTGSGGAIYPGLAGSVDVRAGGAFDDEFDTVDATDPLTGWTTMGALTAHSTSSAAKSMYYARSAAGGNLVNGIFKAAPTIPFTVTMKIDNGVIGSNYQMGGLVLCVAGGAGALTFFGLNFDSSGGYGTRGLIVMKCSNPATFSSLQHTGAFAYSYGADAFVWPPVYLRIVVNSSSSVDYQYSRDGRYFNTQYAASNPGFTVGAVGIAVRPPNSGYATELYSDWIRFT
jgi:hypothetical protein